MQLDDTGSSRCFPSWKLFPFYTTIVFMTDKPFLVLHGPNLNLFGRREPHIYGTTTLAEINQMLEKLAKELKLELAIKQSNHEGELLDFLHEHMDSAAAAVINPGGLTQHGVSLHDCIKAMPF